MQVENTPSLKPTRSSFIRNLPESMPVEEVIERGREIGLTIQPSDVHSARYYMRQAALASTNPTPAAGRSWLRPETLAATKVSDSTAAPSTAVAKQAARQVAVPQRRVPGSRRPARKMIDESTLTPEQRLRVLVMRLGTDRTRAIIQELENLVI